MAKTIAQPNFGPLKPKVVLGVAAHPDDLEYEYGIAGSVARWVDEGAEAYYLILTNGNKGTDDRQMEPARLHNTRMSEQQAAAQSLGVKQVFFLGYEDGLLQVSPELKKAVVRVIRRLKPDVVLTMDPSFMYAPAFGFINHTDHRAAGLATLDAVFPLARDHLSFPELLNQEGLEPHKVSTLLLTNFERCNFNLDITNYMDKKLQALALHRSQIKDFDQDAKLVRQLAEHHGSKIGVRYAEGFVRIDIA